MSSITRNNTSRYSLENVYFKRRCGTVLAAGCGVTGSRKWGFIMKQLRITLVVSILLSPFLLPGPAKAADLLPDLAMARLKTIHTEDTADGRRLLRFTTTIVNIGSGAFEVRGGRPDSSTTVMPVTQRIYNDTGSFVDRPTAATMQYSGDGHTHWHVQKLQTYELIRQDSGSKVGTGAKTGFCFFDGFIYKGTLPNAPASAVYRRTGCGTASSLAVTMGLSIGWGDKYAASLPAQYIDISGLAPGRYLLQVTADQQNWFAESNEGNQATWAELQIDEGGVTVLRRAPNP